MNTTDDNAEIPNLHDTISLSSNLVYLLIKESRELKALLPNNDDNLIKRHDLELTINLLNGILSRRELYIDDRLNTVIGQKNRLLLAEQLRDEQ